ncbi:MAG: hypothetical protein AAGA22_07885 [Pseudomonadota bacterium]
MLVYERLEAIAIQTISKANVLIGFTVVKSGKLIPNRLQVADIGAVAG